MTEPAEAKQSQPATNTEGLEDFFVADSAGPCPADPTVIDGQVTVIEKLSV